MPIRPRLRRVQLPQIDSAQIAKPLLGAVLGSIYEEHAHLAFTRRREAHKTLIYAVDTSTTTPIGVNQTVRVVWPSSPGCRAVFIGFQYQANEWAESASEETTLGSPIDIRVTANLYNHDAGLLIDAKGCRWTHADDHLVHTVRDAHRGAPASVAAGLIFDAEYAHTGVGVNDAGPAPTPPRLLSVPAADAGAQLRVDLITHNARILHVDVWEAYAREVTL